MAPTTPATGVGARAVAASPAVTSEGNKQAAARPVGLGVPALPPLPGLGIASSSQGLPCKRLPRNVVSMAAGEPSVSMAAGGKPSAAPLAGTEKVTEFVGALKQEWDMIENKYTVTTVALAAILGMWSAGAVVSSIDRLPMVPGVMETVGFFYSGWFAYKNLIFKPDRDALFKKASEFYQDLISG